MRKKLLSTAAMFVVAAAVAGPVAADDWNGFGPGFGGHDGGHHGSPQNNAWTASPIKHLVVIFDENRSFDHYFATYPHARNPTGEPVFKAAWNTPAVNNLEHDYLLTNNPNYTNSGNGSNAANPFPIDRSQVNTAGQNHSYTPEQEAEDNGKADLFPKFTGNGTSGAAGTFGTSAMVMGYYDGNTVTGLWNYAQHYAMSDNAYTGTYGPSTPGALEVISGQTNGAKIILPAGSTGTSAIIPDGAGGFTLIGDTDPAYDTCSSATSQVLMTSKNIGDLLNAAHLTWGSFMGGFDLQTVNANGSTGCARSTTSAFVGGPKTDYIPHHAWFQYYTSTANPTHARPTSIQSIGYSTVPGTETADPANHGYDLNDFYAAVKAGNYPSVSYIKMPAYQDAHPGNSDPLDEQAGVVTLINFLQQQPDWQNTAVIITYDDSDGWYDHAYATPTSASYNATSDQLNGPGLCGTGPSTQPQPKGLSGSPVNGRCGPGVRIPFIVISPFAKENYVSHERITQASVVRFIEDNWLQGERLGGGSFDATAGSIWDMFDFYRGPRNERLILDPSLGTVVSDNQGHY